MNSTAMLVGLVERVEPVDLILFSDTGGEKPGTYEHVAAVSAWHVSLGRVPIVTVRVDGIDKTLEASCLRKGTLPSIAFGYKTCSQRWKADPQREYCNQWAPARECWARGEMVEKLIGYDAGESHRAGQKQSDRDVGKYRCRYPLIEWGWGREDCIEAIERAGLAVPPKSACFFCPSSKKAEILALRRDHPDLFDRAIAMEKAAAVNSTSVVGLGRKFSWDSVARGDDLPRLPFATEIPCECFDGGDE